MDLQFYGANCLGITNRGVHLVVDDVLTDLGLKSVTKAGDVLLFTGVHNETPENARLVIDSPGEYEISDVSITGIPARANMDEASQKTVTIYKITIGELSILCLGHIYPELSEEQMEMVGAVDVVTMPVGGNGYTVDPVGALKLIKEIEPKLVIPTHYADSAIKYPVPQQSLEQAMKELSMEPKEVVTKLKLKSGDLTDVTQLMVLERS